MRESRSSGSVEGVVCKDHSYSDSHGVDGIEHAISAGALEETDR